MEKAKTYNFTPLEIACVVYVHLIPFIVLAGFLFLSGFSFKQEDLKFAIIPLFAYGLINFIMVKTEVHGPSYPFLTYDHISSLFAALLIPVLYSIIFMQMVKVTSKKVQ